MGLQAIVCLSAVLACASAAYYQGCPTLFNFYPDTTDCTKFIRCVWGKPVSFQCPYGTRWSQSLLTCDHAYRVSCGSYPAHYTAGHAYHPQPEYHVSTAYPNTVYTKVPVHPTVPVVSHVNKEPDYYQYVDNYDNSHAHPFKLYELSPYNSYNSYNSYHPGANLFHAGYGYNKIAHKK